MSDIIKLKRSAVAAAVPSSLEFGELALNYNVADGKLYYKNSAGAIVAFATGGGGSANIVEAATAAGFPSPGASQTLYHATDVRRIYFWDATGGVYVEAGPSGGGSGGDGTDAVLRALFVPAAPTIVAAVGGNAQAILSWTAPTVLAQTPITDYTVQFSSNSGSTWTTFTRAASTATSATVTGLINGTAYVFRVAAVNGVGTGAYSSPTSSVTPVVVTQDPVFSNVRLLLHADGSGSTFIDSSATPKTLTATNATQSSTQSKWGGKSMYLDGSSHLVSSSSSDFSVAGQAFAIEFWLYPLALSSTLRSILHLHTGSPRGIHISYSNQTLQVDNGLEAGLSVPNALTQDEWQHVAVARSGGDGATLEMYVNGTKVGSYSSQDFGATSTPLIGWYFDQLSTSRANAYIDDLRITVGSNRGYTGATIIAPTAAFPDS
jgi:hypothetical protein